MSPNNKPLIFIFGSVVLLVFVAILLFTCALPGLQSCSSNAPKITATLSFWGIGDYEDAFKSGIDSFHQTYPSVTIDYKNFPDEKTYEATLLDALASGTGPDIFVVNARRLSFWKNKIAPVNQTQLTLTTLRSLFPQVVEEDFYEDNNVYALPLSIDTLALFYNRDLFDQSAVTPPKTWADVQTILPKLTKTDTGNNIMRAGIALGGSSKTIAHASDIVSALILQNGSSLFTNNTVTLNTEAGKNALTFYSQFSNPRSTSYTWNESMPFSKDAFATEKTAMMIGYAKDITSLKRKNAFLNFDVLPFPQSDTNQKTVSYPTYSGYSVSRASKYPALAWSFLINLTTNPESTEGYFSITKNPPAFRTTIANHVNDTTFGVFARQALTARSSKLPQSDGMQTAFSDIITNIVTGRKTIYDVLRSGEDVMNGLLTK